MKYRLLGICTGLLCLGAAAACGDSSSDSPPSATGPEATSPAASASGSTAPNENPLSPSANPDEPVAIVNDEEITRGTYDEQLALLQSSYQAQGVPFPQGEELAQVKQQLMQQLVQQTLVLQETKTRNITATPEEVDARYQETLSGFPDEATLNQALEEEGLTREDLDRLLDENIRIDKLLDSVIAEAAIPAPTEEELHQLYDLVTQQQELPPFEEVRGELEAELRSQKESEAIQAFVQQLEAGSDVQIVGEL